MLKKDRNFASFFTFLPLSAIIISIMNPLKTSNPAIAASSPDISADIANKNAAKQLTDLKLIVFDMGKVFVHFDWGLTYDAFAKATKSHPDSVKDAFSAVYFPYERGHITTQEVIDHLNNKLSARLTHAEFAELWTITLDEDTEMTQLLQELRKKFPLYLLSNINEVSFGYLQDKFNVSRHFNELVLSYKVGHIKPAIEIYHEVLHRSKLAAHNCLFIDDLAENIEAAQSIGINTIHFTGINNLRKTLTEFGILT